MLLITIFVELRVVAGRNRTREGRPNAVSGRPMLIHTCHDMPMPPPCRTVPWPWEVAFRTAWSWHGTGAAWARNEMCESNTATLCKSNGKDTIYTLSGTAWARHGNGVVLWISVKAPNTHSEYVILFFSTATMFAPPHLNITLHVLLLNKTSIGSTGRLLFSFPLSVRKTA
jgi:hypothetical protein